MREQRLGINSSLFNLSHMLTKDQLLTLAKITTKDEVKELIEYIAARNSTKYVLTKTAEELNELALVCLQLANKKPDNQPKLKELNDEIGDALMRIDMVRLKMDVHDEDISERVFFKANKYLNYIKTGAYGEI